MQQQQSQTTAKTLLPLWFRTLFVCALLGAIVLVYVGRDGPSSRTSELVDRGALVVERKLFFFDGEDGTINIVDADKNERITTLHTGEDGFMRSVMRGLAKERLANGFGADEPFTLAVWQSGIVSLIDPVTGRTVELSAFGPDNVGAFTRLLHLRS